MTIPESRPRRQLALLSRGKLLTAAIVAGICLTLLPPAPSLARAGAPMAQKNAHRDYALIFGTVWGPDDRPVAGIRIKIRRLSDKKPKWELVSDNNGEFAQRVPPGRQEYLVWAEIKTPKGQPKPQKTVHIENDERVDIGLHLMQVADQKKLTGH